jgi:hypothetical protein
MNERILKLARKTGATVNEGFDGTKNFVYGITMSPEELEKFAELIIKQCAKSLWTEECHNSDLALEEFERNSAKIKEHFGVEE